MIDEYFLMSNHRALSDLSKRIDVLENKENETPNSLIPCPPLPVPDVYGIKAVDDYEEVIGYSEEQMYEFARAYLNTVNRNP